MNPNNADDILNFSKITAGVFANCGAIATEPLLDLWFETACKDGLSIDQWSQAAQVIIRSRKFTSQPTYADFYETICGVSATETDTAAEQANIVMRQVRDLGSYRTPVFDDPITKSLMTSRWSWQSVCSMTESEHKWWAKEFIEAYQSITHIGVQDKIDTDSPRLKLLAGGIGKGK